MDAYEVTLYNDDEAVCAPYTLQLSFAGPALTTPSDQALRRETATSLCSTKELRTGPLHVMLSQPTTFVALMYIELGAEQDWDTVPESLRNFMQRDSHKGVKRVRSHAREAGFYAFDAQNPAVLSYICMVPGAQHHRLGALLYMHYEMFVRSTYPDRTCRLYVAALRFYDQETSVPFERQPVVSFYQKRGFVAVDVEQHTVDANDYHEFADGNAGATIKIHVPEDTLLMTKTLCADAPAPVPIELVGSAPVNPLADSSSSSSSEPYSPCDDAT